MLNPLSRWNSLERLTLTIWVGGLWISGFVVAPILFANLERQVAGNIAGHIFQATSYIGISCLLVLLTVKTILLGRRIFQSWQSWMLLVALIITLFGEFYLAEAMRDLKILQPALEKGSQVYTKFARLHGISSALFLVNSLFGLILVLTYQTKKLSGKNSHQAI